MLTGDQDILRSFVELPKCYVKGNDPNQWIKEAELFSKITKIDLELIIQARTKGTAADEWVSKPLLENESIDSKFLRFFSEEKNIFQVMEEMQNVKQGENKSFDAFYDRTERMAAKFMEMKPTEAVIHKNLILKGSKDSGLIGKYVFEPEMSRKQMKEVGIKFEEAFKLKNIKSNSIVKKLD